MEGSIGNKGLSKSQNAPAEFEMLNIAYEYVNTVLVNILKSITIESLLIRSIETWHSDL